MKKIILLVALLLLVLDWLALDDITTGNELSFFGEYVMLALSVLAIPFLIISWKKSR